MTREQLFRLLAPKRRQLLLLWGRIERLEGEIQEIRRLNRHVAEIADLVQEVLVPAAQRDDERVRRLLEEYRQGL